MRYYFPSKENPAIALLADPKVVRLGPALVNYDDRTILVVGGHQPRGQQTLASVQLYSILMQCWLEAPDLNVARTGASGC